VAGSMRADARAQGRQLLRNGRPDRDVGCLRRTRLAVSRISAAEFRKLLTWEKGEALRDLLGDVGRALARMEAAHKKARRTVVRLQRLLKRKGGKPRQR
jgi:hypothetical protein